MPSDDDELYYAENGLATEIHNLPDPSKTGKWRPGPAPKLRFQDALCLTLCQYRQGVFFYVLAHLFGVATSTCNNVFHTMTAMLRQMVRYSSPLNGGDFNETDFEQWDKLKCFESDPQCVLVMDCTEAFSQYPDGSIYKKILYSPYKHHSTLKFLIVIDVRGNIVYVSDAYPGRISDTKIVEKCEKDIFTKLWPGSKVMVDKGFNIENIAKKYGVDVTVPPRVTISRRFTTDELDANREIAKTRIHVERAIRRAKSFEILTDTVSISMLPNFGAVAEVCYFLSNGVGHLVNMNDDTEKDIEVVEH